MNLIPQNIISSGGILTANEVLFEVPIKTNVSNPNAYVTIDFPSDFTYLSHEVISQNPSTYDSVLNRWDIGLLENETATLKLKLTFNEPADLVKDYTFEATVFGLDTIIENNSESLPLKYQKITPIALGATNPSTGCTGTVDVTSNDTACTEGVSEWRLNESSLVNAELNSWDNGKGCFKYLDPSQPITGTYDLYCVFGGQESKISCDETFTIPALVKDNCLCKPKSSFKKAEDLTQDEITSLELEHPNLTITDYCWSLLTFPDGTATGIPFDCNQLPDQNSDYSDVQGDYDENADYTSNLPSNPDQGDVHTLMFDNGLLFVKYDGTSWIDFRFVETRTPISQINWNNLPGIPSDLLDGDDDTQLTGEQVQDLMNTALAHNNHSNITVTYDDTNNQFLISSPVGSNFSGAFSDLTGVDPTLADNNDANTTYTMSISGNVITLSDSDGNTSTVTIPNNSVTWATISGRPSTLTQDAGNITGTIDLDNGEFSLTAPVDSPSIATLPQIARTTGNANNSDLTLANFTIAGTPTERFQINIQETIEAITSPLTNGEGVGKFIMSLVDTVNDTIISADSRFVYNRIPQQMRINCIISPGTYRIIGKLISTAGTFSTIAQDTDLPTGLSGGGNMVEYFKIK